MLHATGRLCMTDTGSARRNADPKASFRRRCAKWWLWCRMAQVFRNLWFDIARNSLRNVVTGDVGGVREFELDGNASLGSRPASFPQCPIGTARCDCDGDFADCRSVGSACLAGHSASPSGCWDDSETDETPEFAGQPRESRQEEEGQDMEIGCRVLIRCG